MLLQTGHCKRAYASNMLNNMFCPYIFCSKYRMYDVYNVSYGYLFYFACTTLSEETRGDGEKKKEGYSG